MKWKEADGVRDRTGWLGQEKCAEASMTARLKHHTNSGCSESYRPLAERSIDAMIIELPFSARNGTRRG